MTARQNKMKWTRLNALELAKKLDNVSGACRQTGLNRPHFFDYKKRLLLRGLDELLGLPPMKSKHWEKK